MSTLRHLVRAGSADLFDVGLALLATALSWSVLTQLDTEPSTTAWILASISCLALVGRRRAPIPSFGVSIVAGSSYLALGLPIVGLGLAPIAGVYSLGAHASRRHSLTGLALVELVLAALLLADRLADVTFAIGDPGTLIGDGLVVVAAWALGDGARRRRDLTALYLQRAVDLEAAQAEVARHAVIEERVRIARELHDIVAHSMSVIAVQAGTGRTVIDDDVATAKASLVAIEDISRGAMDEMRRMLGVLRSDDARPTGVEPTPGLADLDRLVAEVAASGTTVDIRIEGDRRPLSTGAELAVYRIVQEALTNVRRHAPGATARLRLAYADDAVIVDVSNELRGATHDAGSGLGLGLVGMRERAALYGGSVRAEREADGTFRVAALFPYGEVPA